MIAPSGNEALLLLSLSQKLVCPCFSTEILQEEEVLRRPKFGFEADEVKSLLRLIRRRGEFIPPVSILSLSPDPGDDKFIACALGAKSEFLVTGNKLSGILAVRHETGQRGGVDSTHRSSPLSARLWNLSACTVVP